VNVAPEKFSARHGVWKTDHLRTPSTSGLTALQQHFMSKTVRSAIQGPRVPAIWDRPIQIVDHLLDGAVNYAAPNPGSS